MKRGYGGVGSRNGGSGDGDIVRSWRNDGGFGDGGAIENLE